MEVTIDDLRYASGNFGMRTMDQSFTSLAKQYLDGDMDIIAGIIKWFENNGSKVLRIMDLNYVSAGTNEIMI